MIVLEVLKWLVEPGPGERLTRNFILAIALYLLLSSLWFFWKTDSLRKRVERLLRNAEGEEGARGKGDLEREGYTPPEIDEFLAGFDAAFETAGNPLTPLWREYTATFLREARKTTHDARNYFDVTRLLSISMDLRYWFALPGLFVGVGVLGTFVGLTWGLSDFQLGNDVMIRESIGNLLRGMKTAFGTSIAGMLSSILFSLLEKTMIRRVERRSQALVERLNATFLLTEEAAAAWQEERLADRIDTILSRHLSVTARTKNGEEIELPIGRILQKLLDEAEEVRTAIKSFSTDLAEGIMLSTETIQALGDRLRDAVGEAFGESFGPLFEEMKRILAQIEETGAQSNAHLIERLEGELSKILQEIGKGVEEIFSTRMAESLERIAQIVETATGQLDRLPHRLDEALQEMTAERNRANALFSETVHSMQTANEQQIATTRSLLKGVFSATRQELQRQTETFAGMAKGFETTAQQRLQRQEEALSTFLARFTEEVEEARRAQQLLFEEGTKRFQTGMRESFQNFEQGIEGILSERMTEPLEKIVTTAERSTHLLERLPAQLQASQETIAAHIEGLRKSGEIFEQRLHGSAERLEGTLTRFIEKTQREIERAEGMHTRLLAGVRAEIEAVRTTLTQHREHLEAAGKLTAGMNDTLSGLHEGIATLDRCATAFSSHAASVEESGRRLIETLETFQRGSVQATERLHDVLAEIEQSLQDTTKLHERVTHDFFTIREGLSGIFEEIEKGLGRYQETTRDSLNQYLRDFAENLSQAADRLKSMVEELSELLEDVVEMKEQR